MANFSGEHICNLYGDELRKFRELATSHDAHGKFRNDWADDRLFTGEC